MTDHNHILIIEDDPSLAQSLQIGLEREGFSVAWKSRGNEGVEYAYEKKPHLILLDIRLPDGSGFDFCARIRQLGLSMPIIILTVQRDEIDKVLGLEKGADDYMTKPFSLRELLSRVRAHLRRAYGEFSTSAAKIIRVGDIVIDQSSAKVWCDNRLVNISPTGYRLLTYLARNQGQVLTRELILEEVWGHGYDGNSQRIVDVQISRLREKLGLELIGKNLIETVPGIGYRLVKL